MRERKEGVKGVGKTEKNTGVWALRLNVALWSVMLCARARVCVCVCVRACVRVCVCVCVVVVVGTVQP